MRLDRAGPAAIGARLACVFTLALSWATPALAQAADESLPVRATTLSNGLRLLVYPTVGAPTVSFVMQFRVGGVNERLGETGIAHLLEHLLFKGTESIGTRDVVAERALFREMDATHDSLLEARALGDASRTALLAERIALLEDRARAHVESNEFDRILTREGAQGLNAMTTSESTVYFVELPANRAELFFALEADRMTRPVFREFYTERDVVLEERRMRVDTSPAGALYEAHLASAYTMHPYGVPVVGYMSDLERLGRTQVEVYYRRYYGPANAVLAVVGAVDPERIEAWAEHYLGSIPPAEVPPPVLAVEPSQRGERRVVLEWDAEPQLRIGWHVPASQHPDAPALAMLTAILTGGRTARLHRRLVLDDRVATGIFSSLGPGSLHPQLLQIDASPRAPHTPEDLERAVYDEIERLAREGPTESEIERVRNQIASGTVRGLRSNLGLAFQLADAQSLFGDWREAFRRARRVREVTPADVARVASTYLTPANRTVATLVRVPGR